MICVCILLREWSCRLNRKWFWRSRKSNLRPLVYKALQLSTTPWGLLGKSTGSDYAVQDCVLCSSYIDINGSEENLYCYGSDSENVSRGYRASGKQIR